MSFSKISGLQEAVLIDHKVLARINSAQMTQPLELAVGEVATPFEPLGSDQSSPNTLDWPVRLATDKLEGGIRTVSASGEIEAAPEVSVNKLADWSLSGTETVQIMVADRERPFRLDFEYPIRLGPADRPRFLKAFIAAHRAKATLIVTIIDGETGKQKAERIPFDPSKRGGQLSDGYQAVTLAIPPANEGADVFISVDYEAFEDDGLGHDPWVFLADVQVASRRGPTTAVTTPLQIIRSGIAEGNDWLVADLPAIVSGLDQIKLKAGGEAQLVGGLSTPDVEIVENYGHVIACRASEPCVAVLRIDGEAALRMPLSPETAFFRIPARFLNGAIRQLTIMDQTGSIVICQIQHLMPWILTPTEVIQRETSPPFPTAIFAQAGLRYESLKAHVANSKKTADFQQLAYALDVLEGGYVNVKLQPLKFPKVTNPTVSVIIPAHNKVEVTYLALCSLLLAYNETSFEVIVVDDGSTDETSELESIVSGIKVVRNSEPLRFIRACNKGAEAARGAYIALLNNDVEVTHRWLDELIGAFDRFENVGLAGSKLLYPNGDLQDAGGIIWGSGNPWNYGNRQNPNEPRFSYARQADYLSGAAMLTPKSLWKELEGLSNYLEPMYFEDTDFAFKVREAGYKTWFVPSSVVYHHEGMTSGTDTSSGLKRFQEVNRPKFKRRWAREFSSFGQEGVRPDLEKDRGIVGRVLFVDYSTPLADRDAGSYAALEEIKLVQSLGYKVTFLPMNMGHLGRYTAELQKMGVEVIYAPFFTNPAEYLQKHAADFDAFYITRYYVAREVLPHIRRHVADPKILFNNADLHFLREIRTARAENDPGRLEAARRIRAEEMEIIDQVDVVLSYNEVEHSVIEAFSESGVKVMKCPWTVKVRKDAPPVEGRQGLSFLGSFKHHPNVEGIDWFVRSVVPQLASAGVDAPLSIYGSAMPDTVRAMARERVVPAGFVENIEDAFDPHRIFVAPLLSGAGIKGKVMSALSNGIPCVLTSVAAEGIGLRHEHDCLIVETVEDWCEAIKRLNTDDELWNRLSANALDYLDKEYSFEKSRRQMLAAFEAADLFLSVR